MADPKFQLVQLFGTSDLLSIVGIRSIEFYQNSCDDINLLKQSYLRRVITNHPSASGQGLDTPEGVKEAVIRSKKLFVMNDIFKFLTDNSDFDLIKARKEYFSKGTIPDFPCLKYLRENSFKGDKRDFEIPEFEIVAAELKKLYQLQMKKIKEMQDNTYVPDPET